MEIIGKGKAQTAKEKKTKILFHFLEKLLFIIFPWSSATQKKRTTKLQNPVKCIKFCFLSSSAFFFNLPQKITDSTF